MSPGEIKISMLEMMQDAIDMFAEMGIIVNFVLELTEEPDLFKQIVVHEERKDEPERP